MLAARRCSTFNHPNARTAPSLSSTPSPPHPILLPASSILTVVRYTSPTGSSNLRLERISSPGILSFHSFLEALFAVNPLLWSQATCQSRPASQPSVTFLASPSGFMRRRTLFCPKNALTSSLRLPSLLHSPFLALPSSLPDTGSPATLGTTMLTRWSCGRLQRTVL